MLPGMGDAAAWAAMGVPPPPPPAALDLGAQFAVAPPPSHGHEARLASALQDLAASGGRVSSLPADDPRLAPGTALRCILDVATTGPAAAPGSAAQPAVAKSGASPLPECGVLSVTVSEGSNLGDGAALASVLSAVLARLAAAGGAGGGEGSDVWREMAVGDWRPPPTWAHLLH